MLNTRTSDRVGNARMLRYTPSAPHLMAPKAKASYIPSSPFISSTIVANIAAKQLMPTPLAQVAAAAPVPTTMTPTPARAPARWDGYTGSAPACRWLAAKDKTPPKRSTYRIQKDGQTASAHELQVTKKVNAANLINLQYSLYKLSKTPEAFASLQATIQKVLPDLGTKPSDAGVVAFMDFENNLLLADAQALIDSMKVYYALSLPGFTLANI